jgi:exo-1,4-beta-D-glucosaminidase
LAAQVANGDFKDIYFADNIRKLPGMDYPFGELFSNMDMASGSPYACSWWYRTEFQLPQDFRGQKLWLHFNGINYKANIWLNGRRLADANDVAGAYRIYELDATRWGEEQKQERQNRAPNEAQYRIHVFPPSVYEPAVWRMPLASR